MAHALIVGIGGFFGAIVRYWLQGLAQRWLQDVFPIGTLAVNLLGCLAIGSIMYLVEYREFFGPELRIFLTIGILGGFTTFSTFGYETFMLLRDGQYASATVNVLANVVLGLLGVTLGWLAARAAGI
jgi:fluoride exporter